MATRSSLISNHHEIEDCTQFAVSARNTEPPLKDIDSSGMSLLQNDASERENVVQMVLYLHPSNINPMISSLHNS
jgi:hypothetical protein